MGDVFNSITIMNGSAIAIEYGVRLALLALIFISAGSALSEI